MPPGRAGRLWLTRRLQVARRGADLLDRKLRILQAELGGRREAAAQTAEEWDRCCAEAERWLLRASMLGGERAVRLAADGQAADVTIAYPSPWASGTPPAPPASSPPPPPGTGRRLPRTRQAHAAALTAAVRHAAAAEALRVVEAEALATRYRLRAIRDRWIPRLEQALAEVTLALEEQELADAARLRLAVTQTIALGEVSSLAETSITPSTSQISRIANGTSSRSSGTRGWPVRMTTLLRTVAMTLAGSSAARHRGARGRVRRLPRPSAGRRAAGHGG